MSIFNSLTNFETRNLTKTNKMRESEIFDYLINIKVFLQNAKLVLLTESFTEKEKL